VICPPNVFDFTRNTRCKSVDLEVTSAGKAIIDSWYAKSWERNES